MMGRKVKERSRGDTKVTKEEVEGSRPGDHGSTDKVSASEHSPARGEEACV